MLDPGCATRSCSTGSTASVNDGEGTAYAAFRDYEGPHGGRQDGHRADRRARATPRGSSAITNPENDPALPQYVVVAMVEEGGFGADVAAPIVRRVIDFLNGNPTPAARSTSRRSTPNEQKQD